jgi:ubiquinone/menaquinone biosynthesis C-methylase UbiE
MNHEQGPAQQQPSGYFINQELVEEMVRLNRQGRLFTEAMGGVLAEQSDLSAVHAVLDLACGPGEWAMQVAREHPDMQVVGVDVSQRMIEYAAVQAQAQELANVSFQVMDITQPLAFPDASFDLVSTRTILAFMKREAWLPLLKECARILRPGGILRTTEQETVLGNDPAFETYCSWWYQAFQQAGQAFSLPGQHHLGVTLELKRLLRQAGLRDPRHLAQALDFSTGAEAHVSTMEDFLSALKLGAPFLIRLGIATQEQISELRERLHALIGQEGFCGYWFFLTIWAQKP